MMPSDDFKRILSQTDNWADWRKKAFEDQTGLKLQEMKNKYLIADQHQNQLMTITEAIQHCREKEDCTPCGQEHRQLREWLEDYQSLLIKYDKLTKYLKDYYDTVDAETDRLYSDGKWHTVGMIDGEYHALKMIMIKIKEINNEDNE